MPTHNYNEMVIGRERVDEVVGDILPLLFAHYAEVTPHPDIALEPDLGRYYDLEAANILRLYTARYRGDLVGYHTLVVGPSLHARNSLRATQDLYYVCESFRYGAIGAQLLTYAEQSLKREGVDIIHQHVTARKDFGAILKRRGYVLVEWIYEKRL